MITRGLNIDEVEQLASVMARHAAQIGSVISSVSESLANVSWVGPDVDRINADWPSQRAHLAEVSMFLEAIAESARQTAAAQSAASSIT